MRIVPVIDLKGGRVVHAQAGQRERYQPIRSTLTAGSEPLAVVEALLAFHPFGALYVADLDAIEGRGNHFDRLAELERRFPGLDLWVDAGLAGEEVCRRWLASHRGRLVLGSESQNDASVLTGLSASGSRGRLILSLDFLGDDFLGPAEILDKSWLWPEHVIVMTLGRVGGMAGPDTGRLASLRAAYPDRQLFAAGGVRDAADLQALAELGVAGVLVASALHDGRLARSDLRRFQD